MASRLNIRFQIQRKRHIDNRLCSRMSGRLQLSGRIAAWIACATPIPSMRDACVLLTEDTGTNFELLSSVLHGAVLTCGRLRRLDGIRVPIEICFDTKRSAAGLQPNRGSRSSADPTDVTLPIGSDFSVRLYAW